MDMQEKVHSITNYVSAIVSGASTDSTSTETTSSASATKKC